MGTQHRRLGGLVRTHGEQLLGEAARRHAHLDLGVQRQRRVRQALLVGSQRLLVRAERPAFPVGTFDVFGEVVRTDDHVLVNPFASYRRKLFGHTWTLQVNVNNVFDKYYEVAMPNGTTGFRTTSNINVTWFQQPRSFIWTNTLKF